MASVNFKIEGDSQLMSWLDGIGRKAQQNVADAVKRSGDDLAVRVQTTKLSGQKLNIRTGRLINSIRSDFTQDVNSATSVVSTDVPYAAVHEYGFQGVVTVRAHLRTMTQAFGKPVIPRKISVREHTMRMNLPQRSFMRSALEDAQQDFVDSITAALQKSVK